MSLGNVKCVVLNASYEPLSVISYKRALVLVLEGKATILEEHPDLIIHSVSDIWPVPTQIVLNKYVKSRSTYRIPAVLTQKNLFIRDKYTCQYCKRHVSELTHEEGEVLTRDHVIPQTKGGPDEWENVVTACSTCNNRKADTYLSDSDFILNTEPSAPTVFEIWSKSHYRKMG